MAVGFGGGIQPPDPRPPYRSRLDLGGGIKPQRISPRKSSISGRKWRQESRLIYKHLDSPPCSRAFCRLILWIRPMRWWRILGGCSWWHFNGHDSRQIWLYLLVLFFDYLRGW